MKSNTKKKTLQKIIFALLLIVLVFNFISPQIVLAADDDEADNGILGSLLKEILQLFASLGDVVMGALNKFMLGADEFFSAMLSQDDVNLEPNSGSWLVQGIDQNPDVRLGENYMDKKNFLTDASNYQIPNMLYSPESIFANNIAMLDINFLDPNSYSSINPGIESADKMAQSAAGGQLQKTIADWYKSFRNIAVVSLLSMLVYLGIRILISSTAADKAKYKESLKNWFVALCLVFVIHFIMSGILMLTENFNALFSKNIDQGILVEATPSDEYSGNSNGKIRFKTNLVGLARFRAQADTWQDATAYTIIYLALVIYTCIFTFMYFKRFLYMAFFTMIAPLVALTYPIDKAGDGKAQAFNIWFKEYTMNAIIQPVHLILYTVFVSSAIDLAVNNPIYAIVAIAFLIPAEKFIKKMFGLDKAESEGGIGSFAGGALAMKGLQSLAKLGGNKSGKSSSGGSESAGNEGKIRFNKANSSAGKLESFNQRNDNLQGDDERARIASNGEETENEQTTNAQGEENSERQRGINNQYNELVENDSNGDGGEAELEGIDLGRNGQPPEGENPESSENLQIANNLQPQSKWERRKKIAGAVGGIAGSMAWKGIKKGGRALARTTGAVGGAAVGLAAGLTTGDMSKALSFAATGAMAGNAIGKNAANAPGRIYSGSKNMVDKARNGVDQVADKINVAKYGYADAKKMKDEKQNARILKSMYKDKEELKKARELAAKLPGFTGNEKEIIDAKADFYKAGITDETLINNAIEESYKESGSLSGKTHKEYVDMAAYVNKGGFTARDIRDQDSMNSIEERVQANVKKAGGDAHAEKEVMTKVSGLLGERNLYEQRSREGKTRIKVPNPPHSDRTTRTNSNGSRREN